MTDNEKTIFTFLILVNNHSVSELVNVKAIVNSNGDALTLQRIL